MGVLQDFRRGVDALERIAQILEVVVREVHDSAPSHERLQELERTRSLWEADIEATLLKATGKLQAASNSEARTRTMKKSYEQTDIFDEEGGGVATPVPAGDDAPGEETQVFEVRPRLALNSKIHALRAKYL